ncbi:hepatocyte growth factor-regulated tyrosine kinase substrate [Acyrthosiphon pisum]|uniref:Hepatocyte growth factor-regulated tyrosine kinase substrate n=1 Tax=Acyrthosiphon pisum TaxID=7029 RepID=A0A8R1ZZY1_ACYPI|nr:hepatocyte growth factor-regulated tyrosine kinase substrate [Acyrthosiphon pisum]|eukprot:XP_001943446.1 PREDICTED: hepatocyte growth factor-regulated tyrosine kinase substrate [Acyrthosiphon pisum]
MFKSNFEKLLDKVTSNLLLEADWPTTLEICDTIRQKDVQPKFALNAIKKKLISPNPHTAMYSLLVLECCVKNCGQLVHDEVGTKPFMEQIRETIKTTPHENVKNKLLELLQTWAFAFRAIPKYCAVQDTVNIMKAEGYTFPALKESDAMFSSDVAPGWEDSDCCHRCRVKFGMVQRKHHCRACGQVFCAQCSSRSCTLPKFGIEKPVRVCEACFEKSQKPQINKGSEDLPIEYLTSSLAQQNQIPAANRKTEEELREDEELQLALALSQSEAEQQKGIPFMNSTSIPATRLYSSPPVNEKKIEVEAEDDPELARYLNRSYWESLKMGNVTKTMQTKMASTNVNTIESPNNEISPAMNNEQSDDSEEMELFITSVKSQLEIFVNRIKSNLSRGRTVINGGSLDTFYSKITPMHQKLLQYIQQQDEKRLYFERLQDKLVQVKDTRAALDAMRDDHKAAIQQEAAFAEQQRQIQLAMKLDVLRQRKQQYQQYQHQMTLQQVQQQEQEMAMRMEHQRQNYLNSNMYGPNSLPSMPSAPNPYMSPGPNSLMSSQMQENGIRYPQSTESAHFQHISQPQGFVTRHMIPQNPSSITNNQPVNLPSNEPNNMSQVNSNIPQPIYQQRMAPMTSTINSGVSVSPSMNSMHQQSLPGVGSHTQSMMPGHQQPQMQNMGPPQHTLPVGQPMIPSQHQQPMMGQMSAMPYGGPVHMGQYGAHQIPSQQVNPQPSAPNQVEQPKVEQPQVAELISFD